MINLTIAELAAQLGIEAPAEAADKPITAVMIDSRDVGPGTLFVAFPGEHVDGHDYVAQAVAGGAVAAITSRPIAGAPCLVVPDPLVALGRLGRYVVQRAKTAGLKVVGITGSQGKTSTKDLLAQILEANGPTVAPVGNLNNEIGVPLTASRIDESSRYLISEMGARGVGHIDYLCDLTPPDIGVVLNVGHAHLGEFGSQQAIAQAKGELVEALPTDGTAVLNADDPLVRAMQSRTRARVVLFSALGQPCAEGLTVWASDISSDDLFRHSFRLHSGAEQTEVRLQLTGLHQVSNAVAAAAAALALGLGLADVGTALSSAGQRSRWRMEVHERPDDIVIINDAYNASPDSMRAALETLAELGQARRRTFPQARTLAVLGDMLELGDAAAAEHEALGALVAQLGISILVTIGDNAKAIAEGAVREGLARAESVLVHDRAAAVRAVTDRLRPGDIVMVKASRGIALETVSDALIAADLSNEGGEAG